MWSKEIGADVRDELKTKTEDQYKYCIQVVIGEKKGQGVQASSYCHWDALTDNSCTVQYVNDFLYCFCTVFAIFHYSEKK